MRFLTISAIFAGLLPLLASAADTVCPGGSASILEATFDVVGNDIIGITNPLPAASACECAAKCQTTARCSFFAFGQNQCWLKTTDVSTTKGYTLFLSGGAKYRLDGPISYAGAPVVTTVADEIACVATCVGTCRAVMITPQATSTNVACIKIDIPLSLNRQIGIIQGGTVPTSVTSTTSTTTTSSTTASPTTTEVPTSSILTTEPPKTGTQGTVVSTTTTTTTSAPATTTTTPSQNSGSGDGSGGSDSKGLMIGLAVAGSIAGVLILAAIAMYAYRMTRTKGLEDDAVYTLPWRKSGLFSASAGVGAASNVGTPGTAPAANSTIPRSASTVGRTSTTLNYYNSGNTLYPPNNYQHPSQEGFTVEQYLAAGWTLEQIKTFNPPTLPSDGGAPSPGLQ
ncbi:hypothetical protein HDU97_003595 [Phlyctochytrium planicorne]|nr:hypothetical protein HDU97_003595 [Phlyctochytrium planicorne]